MVIYLDFIVLYAMFAILRNVVPTNLQDLLPDGWRFQLDTRYNILIIKNFGSKMLTDKSNLFYN